MSAERSAEYSDNPHDDIQHELGEGENSGENVGEVVYPYFTLDQDPNELMDMPEHARFRQMIDAIHSAGQEAFGAVDARRGLVIKIIGTAAVAAGVTAGVAGVILIKRHNNENKEEKSS